MSGSVHIKDQRSLPGDREKGGRAPNKKPAQGMPGSTINVPIPDRERVRWARVESF